MNTHYSRQVKQVLAGVVSIIALSTGGAGSSLAAERFSWVQYVPGGIEARAITDATECPKATIDGQIIAMSKRSTPGERYPITTCAMQVPKGTKEAAINDVPLPLPVEKPQRILVIGDTGCRLKGKVNQGCNDIADWPFRINADISAEMKPDLVIHVGDFHYREGACPIGNRKCAGSPSGDTWDVWRADFFSPSEALLQAAPWVMVRGNHEECDRGGIGWSRTLDPYTFDNATGCLGLGKPYTVDLGGVTLAVWDVSTASEGKLNEGQAAVFREQFKALANLADQPVWLAQHRPIWSSEGTTKDGQTEGDNKTLATAGIDSIPAKVQAMFSGHHHVFRVMNYQENLPIQIISGHGGDELMSSDAGSRTPAGLKINNATVKYSFEQPGIFGFAMLERDGGNWKLTNYDVHGRKLANCAMTGRLIDCKATVAN